MHKKSSQAKLSTKPRALRKDALSRGQTSPATPSVLPSTRVRKTLDDIDDEAKWVLVDFDKISFEDLSKNSWKVFDKFFGFIDDVTEVAASGDCNSQPPLFPPNEPSASSSSSSPSTRSYPISCDLPEPSHLLERRFSEPRPSSELTGTEGSTPSPTYERASAKRKIACRSPSPHDKKATVDLADLPRHSKNHASIARKRRKERQDKADRHFATDPELAKRICRSGKSMTVVLDLDHMPVVRSGYTATPGDDARTKSQKEVWYMERLLLAQIEVVEWDGVTPLVLLNKAGQAIAVLAGRPDDQSYLDACTRAHSLLEDLAEKYGSDSKEHLRGRFHAVHAGFSYGNGMVEPGFVGSGSATAEAIIEAITSDKDFQRIAGYQNGAFSIWAPKVYKYIAQRLQEVYDDQKKKGKPVNKPFLKSLFTMFTANFGPNAWTYKHRDIMNIAFGWCCITALGLFNHKTGGHLILHDIKKAFVFPSGSTILIPSAILAHSNVPIESGWRGSFTQYVPGGLLRWADQSFQTADNFELNDPEGFAEWMQLREHHWSSAMGLYSTHQDLRGKTKTVIV